jgi:pimeloyl-ACP methyl ester carboxylesterase
MTMALPLSAFDALPGSQPAATEPPRPVNVPMDLPGPEQYTDEDRARLEWMIETESMRNASSHAAVQTSEPQTLGFALNDSPVGLAAWLLQRRRDWSLNRGNIEEAFSKDESLNLVMLYWLTETATTTFRYYWEAAHDRWRPERDSLPVIEVPTGISLFAGEPYKPPNAWMREYYNLVRVTDLPEGGHFAPAEAPDLWVSEVREFFRPLR